VSRDNAPGDVTICTTGEAATSPPTCSTGRVPPRGSLVVVLSAK
jgi:hypothetical protein